jgi:raffinose/stachyose/melibiose transport system substrate-binding protein
MKKKILLSMFLCLVAAASLTVYGAAPKTITFTALNNGESEVTAFEEIFKSFEKATGNKVELQELPNSNEYENIIKIRFSTNDPPDIFYFYAGPNEYVTLRANENLMEVTGEKFVKTLTDAVRDFYTVDKKVYGIPWGSYNALGVFYNKDVFKKAGVSVPKNYKDFLNICEKLKKAGITPVYEAGKTVWPTQIFTLCGFQSLVMPTIKGAEGVQRLKENKLRIKDIPELKRVFERYYNLKTKGFMNEDLMSATYEMQESALVNGEAAMVFQGDWIMPDLDKKFGNSNKIGYFPLPSDNNSGVASLYPPKQLFVTKTTKNANVAMELARFMTKPENVNIWYKYNPGIPVYKNSQSKLYPSQQDIFNYIKTGKGIVQIQLALTAGFMDFDKICQEFIITGDADKAVTRMDENYLKDGKNKKIPGF